MLGFYPGSIIPDNAKRYQVFDQIGYFRSYTSRRRALQAIKDIQKFYTNEMGLKNCRFKLRDSYDNNRSFL